MSKEWELADIINHVPDICVVGVNHTERASAGDSCAGTDEKANWAATGAS